MNTIITDAIEKRQLLSFNYEGLFRVVEPHCFGINSKGNQVLRAYQVDGESSSGFFGWKLYDISKIRSIQLLSHVFETFRDGYKKGDKGMVTIIREL